MHLTADTLKDLPRQQRVNLINSLSGFKSANLLGTRASNGQENLSIVSSCFHLGADPALIGMIIRPHSVDRHSLELLYTQPGAWRYGPCRPPDRRPLPA